MRRLKLVLALAAVTATAVATTAVAYATFGFIAPYAFNQCLGAGPCHY